MRTYLLAACLLALLGSCSSQLLQRKPANSLFVHYRFWKQNATHLRHERTAVSTSIYRDLAGKSLYSECRMVPHDSEYFDQMLQRCGLRAVFRSAARLFLERAASTEFLTPVRMDGQLKWIDLLGESCEPL